MIETTLFVAAMAVIVTAAVSAGLCYRRLREKNRQIAALQKEAEAARTLDETTELLNYPTFVKAAHIQIKLARRHKWPVTLMVLDIDNLEKINLHHSYRVGDEALRHLAAALRSVVRSSDVLGRFGGSGFFLLMPECDQDHILNVFTRIRKKLQEPLKLESEKSLTLKFRAGAVTMYGLHAQLRPMMELAEKALDMAKESDSSLKIVDQDGIEIKSVEMITEESE